MSDLDNEYSFFSKKDQRKLTPFLARSLYYDYLRQKLDNQRKQALEEFMEAHPEASLDLGLVEQGLEFFGRLSQANVAQEVLDDIGQERVGLQRRLGSAGWYQWPTSVRWFIEASVAAIMVFSVSLLLPWDNLINALSTSSNYVVLTEMASRFNQSNDELTIGRPDALVGSGFAPTEGEASPVTQETARDLVTKSEIRKMAGLTPQDGMVNRLYMKAFAIDETTEQIKAQLKLYKIEKIGDADLGWRRPGGSYFHFRVGEESYEPLMNGLKRLGYLQIRQEPSEEVSPEGTQRIVLWVQELERK